MASYDALRHVSIGQYIPADSAVHRLDPRTKLAIAGLGLVAVVVTTTYVPNMVLLVAILAAVRVSRLSARYMLAGIVPALPVIALLALMQLLFYGNGQGTAALGSRVLLSWGAIRISTAGVRLVIVSLMRFVDLLFLTSLLTNTTTSSALTHGMESLLRPLSAIGLPSHELALVCAIALRFLPILGEEAETIAKAQASRGLDEPRGGRLAFVQYARRLAALIVPLFVDAYRRAEEMTMAMQARCYRGGRGRTYYTRYALGRTDWIALGLTVGLLIVVALAQYSPLP